MTAHADARLLDVLIADDDADFRVGLRRFLEHQGYRCGEAAHGRQALEVARGQWPRWVLLDLLMPELDGFAVARQLRADPLTREARIHGLTGLTGADIHVQAQQAGFESVLTKPVNPSQLLSLLHRGPA